MTMMLYATTWCSSDHYSFRASFDAILFELAPMHIVGKCFGVMSQYSQDIIFILLTPFLFVAFPLNIAAACAITKPWRCLWPELLVTIPSLRDAQQQQET
jgi:hypothetical protein